MTRPLSPPRSRAFARLVLAPAVVAVLASFAQPTEDAPAAKAPDAAADKSVTVGAWLVAGPVDALAPAAITAAEQDAPADAEARQAGDAPREDDAQKEEGALAELLDAFGFAGDVDPAAGDTVLIPGGAGEPPRWREGDGTLAPAPEAGATPRAAWLACRVEVDAGVEVEVKVRTRHLARLRL